jgi:hypothetical protein
MSHSHGKVMGGALATAASLVPRVENRSVRYAHTAIYPARPKRLGSAPRNLKASEPSMV